MEEDVLNWLLEGPQWLKFAVKRNIFAENPSPLPAADHPDIKKILHVVKSEDKGFPAINGTGVSYKKELFWYMYFLSDIGFASRELGLDEHFERVLSLEDKNHGFLLSAEMKPGFHCISSILLASMVKMSQSVKQRLVPHIDTLLQSIRSDGGWHCAKSRQAGAKLQYTDSCPMDNLNVLHLLGQYESLRTDSRLNGAIDFLLAHWRRQDEPFRPYGFGIGTQFKKLKYPEAKYGILRMLDTLSLFTYARKSPEYKQMLEFIKSKAEGGKYIPESVVQMFTGFDFAQKKDPSRWITFIVNRLETASK